MFDPKQFTVGVLNATLDVSALVLVGASAFLGLEVVLSPFMWSWVLVGVSAFLGLEMFLSPFMWRWVLVGPTSKGRLPQRRETFFR